MQHGVYELRQHKITSVVKMLDKTNLPTTYITLAPDTDLLSERLMFIRRHQKKQAI